MGQGMFVYWSHYSERFKTNLYIQISVFKQQKTKNKTECMYHRLENI